MYMCDMHYMCMYVICACMLYVHVCYMCMRVCGGGGAYMQRLEKDIRYPDLSCTILFP